MSDEQARAEREERINVNHEYELCAWARHFNASEKHVREAVHAVGDRADRVREHLAREAGSQVRGERPSGH